MSVAYFIVLDKEDIEFDPFVNGKEVARRSNQLLKFCKKHGLRTFEDFLSQDNRDLMEEFDNIELPEQKVKWFAAKDGIDWIDSLIKKLQTEPLNFPSEPVIQDLYEYKEVLINAEKVVARWHLELDF